MSTRVAPRGPALLIAAVVLVLGYALDQITKFVVSTRMHEYQSIDVIPGVLRWFFIRNSGAAFSLGEGHTWIFTIFMALVALALCVFVFPRVRTRLWGLAAGGLLAGTLGNLTDRLFRDPGFGRGHVVDFISVGHFAIFNVADSCIVVSMIGIVLLLWCGVPLAPKPAEDAAGEEADPEIPDSGTRP